MICSDDVLSKLATQDLAMRIIETHEEIYRDLPWRNIDDPYAVYISEIMLQQTQVSRVLKYWTEWMQKFPCIETVALADLGDILDSWQGLGYNRRALSIKKTCDICTAAYGGKLPATYKELLTLPGIGKSSAAGICAFALNEPALYIETNVRTVIIHEYLPATSQVKDAQIEEILSILLAQCTNKGMSVRSFYYALLDMGSILKKTHGNANKQSNTYTKQSPFEGSLRQKRSFIIQFLLYKVDDEQCSRESLLEALNQHELSQGRTCVEKAVFDEILIDQLIHEGFIQENSRGLSIASARKAQ